MLCYLLHQVLTAIYPTPTVALATGVVSVTTVPPAVATPAQDVINPSSPLATGVQGSVVATPQPNVAVEVEPKVEVKRESQTDCHAEDGGYVLSSCATNSSLATCVINATAGKASLALYGLVLNVSAGFLLLVGLLCKNVWFSLVWIFKILFESHPFLHLTSKQNIDINMDPSYI